MSASQNRRGGEYDRSPERGLTMPHSGADSRTAAGTFSLWPALVIVACVAATLLWTGWLVLVVASSSKRFVLEPGRLGETKTGRRYGLSDSFRSPRSRQEASVAVARPHNPARSDAAGRSPFRLARTAAAPGRRRSSRPPAATPVPPLPPVSDCPGPSTAPRPDVARSSRALAQTCAKMQQMRERILRCCILFNDD